MATSYPGALDSFPNPSQDTVFDSSGLEHDLQHANTNDAIEAIEAELGTDPAGSFSTVKDRLDKELAPLHILRSVSGGPLYGTTCFSDGYVVGNSQWINSAGLYLVPWLCAFQPGKAMKSLTIYSLASLDPAPLCRFGLYHMNQVGYPTTLIRDLGYVSLPPTSAVEVTIRGGQPLSRGMYWIALLTDCADTFQLRSPPHFIQVADTSYTDGDGGMVFYTRAYADGLPSNLNGAAPDSVSRPFAFWVET